MKRPASDLRLIGIRLGQHIDLSSQVPLQIDLTVSPKKNEPIDLTLSDSEPEMTGYRFNTLTNKRRKEQEAEQRKRRKVEEERRRARLNAAKAGSSSSSNVPSKRSESPEIIMTSSNIQRSNPPPRHGPPSSIRPEINNLGSRPRHTTSHRGSEPPRKKLRTRPRENETSMSSTPKHVGQPEFQLPPSPAPSYGSPLPEDTCYDDTWMEMDFVPEVSAPTSFTKSPTPLPIPAQPVAEPLLPPVVQDVIASSLERSTPNSTTSENRTNQPTPPSSSRSIRSTDNIDNDAELRSIAESDSFDSEEANYDQLYEWCNIFDESRWKPMPPVKNVTIAFQNCSLESKDERDIRQSRGEKIVTVPSGQGYVWDLYAQARKRPTATRTRQRSSKLITDPGYGRVQHTNKAKRKPKYNPFKNGPGAVNRIEQHGGWLAIGCSRTGGQADEPDEGPNPYNTEGSLFVWNKKLCQLKKAHFRSETDSGTFDKTYTINDVKFNNSGSHFVSAGMDSVVKVWKQKGDEDEDEDVEGQEGSEWIGYDLDEYSDGVPFGVAFQPGSGDSNVVAVSTRNIYVYPNLSRKARKSRTTLKLLSDAQHDQITGSVCWDANQRHILYASSESQEEGFKGVHKAFDVNKPSQALLRFKVHEAGDAMALDQLGSLALATQGELNNFLRIFDVRRLNERHAQKVTLEPYSIPNREVSYMTFSPDGVYLALARLDNSVHVYDSRMLEKGVMHIYRHEAARFARPDILSGVDHLHGVTRAEWITNRSGQYRLLSGGEDGCVRLWNPMCSHREPSNGQAIAEINSDIGALSVGDPFKGEYELVVGDSSGEVTVFEGLLNYL